MRESEVTLFIFSLHLLALGIKTGIKTCTLPECLMCNSPNTSAFSVTLNVSSTTVSKWEDVTVTCVHNLPRVNVSITWTVNKNLDEKAHNETFQITKIQKDTEITCNISSICGNFFASIIITVKADNNTVVILICVAAAFGLLVTFAAVMRMIQRKGEVQREARKRQREQNIQNIHRATASVNYW